MRGGTHAVPAWVQVADHGGKQIMLTTIRSTTNAKNKFQGLLALVLLGSAIMIMGLNGCAGVVSQASAGSTTPLTISSATAAAATMTGFQADWTTSVPATSQVNYGKTSSYGSTTGVNSSMVATHQIPVTALAPGTTYHFQIQSKDAQGNSATSADMTVTTLTDTTPPTVSITSPAAGATLSGTAVIFGATASDNVAVASVQFKIDSASSGSPVTAAPYTYTLNTTSLSNGNHTVSAVATDTAGNSATSAVVAFKVSNTTADTTPPTVSLTAPANGATVSNTVTVSANATDNVAVAKVQFQLDNANVGSAVLAAPYTFSWNTTTSTNGAHTLRAIATDTSNNSTTSASVTVTVNNATKDTTPPTVLITAPASGATVSSTVTVSANASDNVAVASVQFQLDNANVGAADTVAPYTYSWNTTTSTNGTHTLRAIATDTSGNATTSASVTVTVNNGAKDTTPPTVSMTAPANGATVSKTVTVSANATDNVAVATVQFQLDNANVGAADTVAPYTYSWNTTTSTNGTHTLRAIATDTSNNSTTSASVTVTVNNSSTDTTPPSVPTGLAATAASSSQINLNWTASTDNVGVTGYKVFRGGTQVGTSATISYSDAGLAASTAYTYTVAAYDAAGNTSAQSASAPATTLAASSGGGLPSSLGWYQIPNTTYAPLCPSGQLGSCAAVVSAWSSGVADTKRNRLEFMGGGHTDYSGNEVYALDLNALTMVRINNPDPPNTNGTDADPSGNPNSRHTYGGLSYIPSTDQIYVHGGALYPTGYGAVSTWLFNVAGMTWKQQDPVSGTPVTISCCNYITFGDYDPQTDMVWYTDSAFLWTYNAHTNTQAQLSSIGGILSDHPTCVIDYTARYFTCFGDNVVARANMAAAKPTMTDITSQTSGCSTLINPNTNPYPGATYDPVQKKIVAWTGGSSVILFDSTALTCTTVSTYTGGPGAAQPNGTNGRWRYFPALGVFALVNDSQQNAWVLRMTPVSGSGTPGPVISAVSVGSITTTGAVVSWTTNVAATSQVEYGPTASYGTMTTLNSTQVTSHSVTLTGLTAGTAYHYAVLSTISGGTQTVSSDAVFSTSSSTDTTPPTVSITSPASGATVTGTVTVTANALDNVGVASVQFMLDGANLGSADTASPYQASWDTTTASNGTHTLTAKALDAAGNVGNAVGVSVTVSNTGSTSSALQDFQNRCAAAGVIVCQGFDDAGGIPKANSTGSGSSGAESADDGTTFPTQDTSITASGAGSLRFDIPVPSGSPNPDGYWRQLTQSSLTAGPATAQLFGQNSTFYLQFRQRMTAAYITNTWGGGTNWKQDIIAVDNSSCGAQEITTVNINNEGFPETYSDCGAEAFIVDLANGDYLLEQGDTSTTGYNCHYQAPLVAPSNCFLYKPNVWMTFYYKIQVGTWGSTNSTIQAWATVNGQGYAGHEWVNMPNQVLNQDGGSVANGFNTVYLVPYWTGGYTGASGPATTWYDELIISTQPIAAPNN